ncbi:NAD(P)-dependent alcohol dehydrogenase [Herbidospora sp. NBRC 101105]|uniref:NAD(P)-dependent alcohol dehydrogenase n=1 Tax=Herbidospora sp. NBRC 101105 TaxID=3032195 RepID=UPI0024A42CF4|nr:NAD(P)-dependent alcohol dehydrogenase [Herbidospora sp. NBRC 101105]GLX98334.1 NADPH:quinone reductase [Herbidospora sp. NBRC 101105]
MKAIVQDRYGPPDILECRDVPVPTPAPGEVLVKVMAASLNARDWHVLRGDPYLARLSFGLRAPKQPVLGTDFAGVVVSGDGFEPGEEVYGEFGGAFAEYVAVPARLVDRKPASLNFEQAAAMPLAATTALQGLAGVEKGRSVLVNGASGGVGTFAVQIAKARGARVTAVCSTRNVGLVASLGADRVVDYRKEDFAATGDRHDVVFDLVGNRSLRDLRRALVPGGTLVVSGGGVFSGGSLFGPLGLIIRARLAARFVKDRIVVLEAAPSRAALAALRELADAGLVVPAVDRTYELADTAEAIRYMETEHARANVVLTVP